MKNRKQLGLITIPCIATTCFATTPANTEKQDEAVLPAVIVKDQRENITIPGGFVHQKARNGILGNKNLLDIPFTQVSHTEKTIETFGNPSLPINNILVNSPAPFVSFLL